MKEAVLILATLGQRWSYRPDGPEPKPSATWATEPKKGARFKPVDACRRTRSRVR